MIRRTSEDLVLTTNELLLMMLFVNIH